MGDAVLQVVWVPLYLLATLGISAWALLSLALAAGGLASWIRRGDWDDWRNFAFWSATASVIGSTLVFAYLQAANWRGTHPLELPLLELFGLSIVNLVPALGALVAYAKLASEPSFALYRVLSALLALVCLVTVFLVMGTAT